MTTAQLLFGALAVAMALPLLLWSLVVADRPPSHAEVVGNLKRGLAGAGHTKSGHGQSRSVAGPLSTVLRRLHPDSLIARLDRLQTYAGRSANLSIERLLVSKVVLMIGFGGIGAVIATAEPTRGRLALAVGITILAYFVPDLLLYSRGQERQETIQNDLADTLDQMTISVEAGLGFDAAMVRAANNGQGPLAEELVRTLQEIQVGVPRRDAFRGLASRTTVEDLRRFVSALLQADTYGIPLVDILRTQAEEIRRKRRHRAEQRAMQIPVKVVFPLVLCILPTLFIVLLGPAALDIMGAFR